MNHTKLLFLITFILLQLPWLQAQTSFVAEFNRNNSTDVAFKTIELHNGNLLIAGHTQNAVTPTSGVDGFVQVFDPVTKDILWSRAYDIGFDDRFDQVIENSNNQIVIGGGTSNDVVTGNDRHMWLLCLDQTPGNEGNVLFSSVFAQSARSRITDLIESNQTGANGTPTYLVTGPYNNFDQSYLARVNNQGGLEWDNTYNAGPPTNDAWSYTLAESPTGTIYLSGSRAFLLQISAQGALLRSNDFTSAPWANFLFSDMFYVNRGNHHNHLIMVGMTHLGTVNSGNIRPIWIEINPDAPDTSMVVGAMQYEVTQAGDSRLTEIEPIRDAQGTLRSFALHSRHSEGGRILHTTPTGVPLSFIETTVGSVGESVTALDNGSITLVGSIVRNGDARVYFAQTGTDAWFGCGDTTQLDTTLVFLTVPNVLTFNRVAENGMAQSVIPAVASPDWDTDTTCCNCCDAALSADYIQVDPDNADPRLADYGIVRFPNSRLYIMENGNYNRMPPRMRFAENVILFVRTSNLDFPTTMDITNCDLVFNHNAGIEVEHGSKIIGNNAVLRPCNERETWKGLKVEGTNDRSVTTTPSGALFFNRALSLHECTFVNAHYAIAIKETVEGSISENLFLNCHYGIAADRNEQVIAITNNTFKQDDHILELAYDVPPLDHTPAHWFAYTHQQTVIERYSLQHVGIVVSQVGSSVGTGRLISQNKFINALSLNLDSNPRYNGIVLVGTDIIDVSNNTFTNNDAAIVANYCKDLSVENNLFEVTRRSGVDLAFYQVVVFGSNNGSNYSNATLIKNNTFKNTADMQRLTLVQGLQGLVDRPNQTDVQPSYLASGTGAIYNYGHNVRIINNDITGFQVGIYTERSAAVHITKNKIESDVYGIYAQRSSGILGCNEITMDLESGVLSNGGVVGVRINAFPSWSGRLFEIMGNCVKNTDRALYLSALPNAYPITDEYTGINATPIKNNYFFNYTEAGLFTDNYTNASANRENIRRNAFISNQQQGVGALGTGAFDVVTANDGSGTPTLNLGENYYGGNANVLAYNLLGAGNPVIQINTSGTDAKPFSECAGMDVGDFTTWTVDEEEWLQRCNDENHGTFGTGSNAVSQRTRTNTIALTAGYSQALTDLSETDPNQAVNVAISTLAELSDDNEASQLYRTAQQLTMTANQRQWLNAAYYSRLQDWTIVLQALNNINATGAEAKELALAKAKASVAANNALTDATVLAELKDLAAQSGIYRHEARELLNQYTDETYTFNYNPVKVYTKTARTTSPLQNVEGSSSLYLLPNPATNEIQVQLLNNNEAWTTAELYDLHGRLLQSQPVNAYTSRFDISTLAPSVYTIVLKAENGEQAAEKFVKQ